MSDAMPAAESTATAGEAVSPIVKSNELLNGSHEQTALDPTSKPAAAPELTDQLIVDPTVETTGTIGTAAGTSPVEVLPDISQGPSLEPVYAGFLMYRKSTSTFPIFHKRYLYFTEDGIPLEKLHAFYEKHRKLKVDKDELDNLVAHAATTGKGLFFFAKTKDAAPSGILECARLTDIAADSHLTDRFAMLYSAKQGFSFEAPTQPLRDAWLLGITKKHEEAKAQVDQLRTSAAFLANLKSIADGTAFHARGAEPPHEILSDDDQVLSKEPESATADRTVDKVKNRGSAIFGGLKDKLPLDSKLSGRNSTEIQSSTDKPESSPVKPKRKSVLAAFISRRSTHDFKKEEAAQSRSESATLLLSPDQEESGEPRSAIADTLATLESGSPQKNVASARNDQRSSASPLKERVTSFLGFFKKTEKRDSLTETVAKPTDITSASQGKTDEVEAAGTSLIIEDVEGTSEALPESAGVLVSTPEDISGAINDGGLLHTDTAIHGNDTNAPPAQVTGSPERRSLVRRLSSFFRSRRSNSISNRELQAKAATDEPPKLPETATIAEAEPAPAQTQANEKQADLQVSATAAATSA